MLAPDAPAFSITSSIDIEPALTAALSTATETDQLEIIVSFDEAVTTADAFTDAVQLTGAGVIGFKHLPMVAALATPAHVVAIQALPGVRSVYLNTSQELLNKEGGESINADDVHALGITGKGVGIAILDTGIDGNHPDLAFPSKTVQNVKAGVNTKDVYEFPGRDSTTRLKTPKPVKKGAELFVENLKNTDTDNGHGTHVAGTAAGNGTASAGKYKGVAPGAHLIGISAAVGPSLPTLLLLAGFDYIIENQRKYNIQVVNNSWGSSGAFRPTSPIAIATKETHDAGITVVFAAGNSGPAQNTMNPHSVAPWVISVAAGCKTTNDANFANWQARCKDVNGRAPVLASFSSRGIPGDPLYHPDILAPGVRIVSTRALTGAFVNALALRDDATACAIATEHVDSYTCINGTSMASPHIAGLVALLEEASGGKLTPDQALAALQSTARKLDGFGEWEVGAGYADALAAVKAVRKR
jgi:serine protease AprX